MDEISRMANRFYERRKAERRAADRQMVDMPMPSDTHIVDEMADEARKEDARQVITPREVAEMIQAAYEKGFKEGFAIGQRQAAHKDDEIPF